MTEVIVAGIFTIIGTLLSVFVAEWNKRGKVNFYVSDSSYVCLKEDYMGGYCNVENSEELPTKIGTEFGLGIYNSSDKYKLVREIELMCTINKKERKINVYSGKKEVNFFNLAPKGYIKEMLSASIKNIDEEFYKEFKRGAEFYLRYKDEKIRQEMYKYFSKESKSNNK